MQKFIWDLDETLLSADFRKEDDFFKEQILDEKVDEFIKNKVKFRSTRRCFICVVSITTLRKLISWPFICSEYPII